MWQIANVTGFPSTTKAGFLATYNLQTAVGMRPVVSSDLKDWVKTTLDDATSRRIPNSESGYARLEDRSRLAVYKQK